MNTAKVEIGKVHIPEDKQKWMKHVARDGTVFATPPGGRKYTDAERRTVDEAVKKVRSLFVSKAKKLRDAESAALKAFKRDPESEKLRAAHKDAKLARGEFDKQRKDLQAKAVREARERALK